jgi:hypothetical protein
LEQEPFLLSDTASVAFVHTPTQLFHNSAFALKKSFNFTKMSSPAVFFLKVADRTVSIHALDSQSNKEQLS